MTIARRLTLLLTVPLLALVSVGLFMSRQLHEIEGKTRFVSQTQIGSLLALGPISRSVTGMRGDIRNYLLADTQEDRDKSMALYRQYVADLDRQLADYEARLISD